MIHDDQSKNKPAGQEACADSATEPETAKGSAAEPGELLKHLSEAILLPLDQFVRMDDRGPADPELADSLVRHGQLYEGISILDPETGKDQLYAGNRRHKAAEFAGLTHFRTRRYTGDKKYLGPIISLLENALRKAEPPKSLVMKIRAAKKAGCTRGELKQYLPGKTKGTISELLYAANLTGEWWAKVEQGENVYKVVRAHKAATKKGATGKDGGKDKDDSTPPVLAEDKPRPKKEARNGTPKLPVNCYDTIRDDDTDITIALLGKRRTVPSLEDQINAVKKYLSMLEGKSKGEPDKQ